MDIHVVKKTISTSSGTGSENTLPIVGGLCRQIYVIAGTDTTSFRFDVTNDHSVAVRSYDFYKQELIDDGILAMRGVYTLRVTDADADGNFTIGMLIQQ